MSNLSTSDALKSIWQSDFEPIKNDTETALKDIWQPTPDPPQIDDKSIIFPTLPVAPSTGRPLNQIFAKKKKPPPEPITGDFDKDTFLEQVKTPNIQPLDSPEEKQRLGLLDRITQGVGDAGAGFVAGLSQGSYKTLKGAKQYMDYAAKKHMEENPVETARLLKQLEERLGPEEIEANKEFNKKFFKGVGDFARDLRLDLPVQQQQRFMTKVGGGFASLPYSFIPGAIAFQVYGDTFDQAKTQGKTDDEAASFAASQALLQEASERIGSAALGKIFKESGKLIFRAAKGFLSESTQELSQEGVSVIAEKVYGIEPDSSLKQRFVDAWLIGGIVGAGAVTAITPIQKAREAVRQRNKQDLAEAVAEGDERKILTLEKEKAKLFQEAVKAAEETAKGPEEPIQGPVEILPGLEDQNEQNERNEERIRAYEELLADTPGLDEKRKKQLVASLRESLKPVSLNLEFQTESEVVKDDRKDEGGLPGSEQDREAVIKTEPDQKGGPEAAPASGILPGKEPEKVQEPKVSELIGQKVNFEGNTGTLTKDPEGNLIVEGKDIDFEVGRVATDLFKNASELNIKFTGNIPLKRKIDFEDAGDTVFINQDRFKFISVNEKKDGVSVTLQRPDGKNITIRDPKLALEIEIARNRLPNQFQELDQPAQLILIEKKDEEIEKLVVQEEPDQQKRELIDRLLNQAISEDVESLFNITASFSQLSFEQETINNVLHFAVQIEQIGSEYGKRISDSLLNLAEDMENANIETKKSAIPESKGPDKAQIPLGPGPSVEPFKSDKPLKQKDVDTGPNLENLIRKSIKKSIWIPKDIWADTELFRKKFIGKYTKVKKASSISIDAFAKEFGENNPEFQINTWQELMDAINPAPIEKIIDETEELEVFLRHKELTDEINKLSEDSLNELVKADQLDVLLDFMNAENPGEAYTTQELQDVINSANKIRATALKPDTSKDDTIKPPAEKTPVKKPTPKIGLTSPKIGEIEAIEKKVAVKKKQTEATEREIARIDKKFAEPEARTPSLFSQQELTPVGGQIGFDFDNPTEQYVAAEKQALSPHTVKPDESLDQATREVSQKIDKYIDTNIPVGLSVGINPEDKEYLFSKKKNDINLPKDIEDIESVSPEVEKNIEDSRGLAKRGFIQGVKEDLKDLMNRFTRSFEHLDPAKYPVTQDILRRYAEVKTISILDAYEVLKGILAPLRGNQKQYKVFSRSIIFKDLMKDVKRGLYDIEFIDDRGLPQTILRGLPTGHKSEQELQADIDKLDKIIAENKGISDALATRQTFMKKLKETLVENKLLPEAVLKYDDYFRHQILEHIADPTKELFQIDGKSLAIGKKGWQLKRIGSSKAFNTEYMEAEFEVMSQAYEQLETKKVKEAVRDVEDISVDLKLIAQNTGKKLKDLIPEDYTEWQPVEGNHFYKALSINDRQYLEIINSPENIVNLSKEDLVEILAMGEKLETWIIPIDVANTLNEMIPEKPPKGLLKINQKAIGLWKKNTVLNPFRAPKYMLNNIFGDMDIVLATYPGILLHSKQSAKEVYRWYRGQSTSEDIREAIKFGIISSGLTIQEIPDITRQKILDTLTGKNENIWNKYWTEISDFNQAREAFLRIAAYKFFKKKLQTNKNMFGVSKPKEIVALWEKTNDIKIVSAKLARELVGDYSNISVAGRWLRNNAIPFYSWMEVNTARYVQLMKNVKHEDNSAAASARIATVLTKKAALKSSILYARMLGFHLAANMWNHLFFPAEEKELAIDDRNQLHIIFGRDEDGKIRTLRLQGAFSDFLSWIELQDFPADIRDLASGKKKPSKQISEMAYATPIKLGLASHPYMRTAYELLTRKSLWPDPTNPRYIRNRGEHLARFLSLDKIYKHAAGLPTQKLDKEFANLLIYRRDPGEAAYYSTMKMGRDWLKKNDIEIPSGDPTRKSNVLYYYKQALRYGDTTAAEKFLNKYLSPEIGGTLKGMRTSTKRAHPLRIMSKKRRRIFMKSLTPIERDIVNQGTNWYKKVFR